MPRRILLLVLGLTLAGASLAWGQPAGEFGGGGFQDRLLEVKRHQLGPALGVNQPTVDKLLAIEARYKPLRRQMIMEMMNDWRRLEQAMAQASPADQEIRTILTSLRNRKDEMHNLQQRQGDEEIAILTPVQQARYMMYQRSLLKEARSIKSGTGGTRPKPARCRRWARGYGWTRGDGGASLSAFRDPGFPSASVRLDRGWAILRRLLVDNSEKPEKSAGYPSACGSFAGFFVCPLAKAL